LQGSEARVKQGKSISGRPGLAIRARRNHDEANPMAPIARFRLYEELNDHLPPERRKKSFDLPFRRGETVADLIRKLEVPAQAVDLVLVNGEPSRLSRRLRGGERVSVYPVFESLDISSVTKVRPRPLRNIRFFVPSGLRGLVRSLRLLGFDCASGDDHEREPFPENDARQGRVLLVTRGSSLRHPRAIRVRGSKPRLQLLEVLDRLDLARSAAPLTRCVRCNTRLAPARRGSKPDPVGCPRCGKPCSASPHRSRMERIANRLLEMAEPSVGDRG
jgi:uncharacterized protein with PIN domain